MKMRVLLVVYDNEMFIEYFPQGLAYIAAVLLKEGYQVDVYSQDKHHYPDTHLTEYLNKNRYDVIGVGVIAGYYQYRKFLQKTISWLNKRGGNIIFREKHKL
jgi:DNA-binding LacI/PurR family transcriptional regulator